MPNLTCKICGVNFQYPKSEREFFEGYLQGECYNCFSIIAKKRYQVNIKGGVTFFCGMQTQALGDTIVRQVIIDEYLRDNPDERIFFLPPFDYLDRADYFRYFKKIYNVEAIDKIFWANRFSGELERPKEAMWFSISSEADWYAKQGKYCRVNFGEKKPDFIKIFFCKQINVYTNFNIFDVSQKNIVFHIRNLPYRTGKDPNKNMLAHECYMALKIFSQYQQKNKIGTIFIVGNDSTSKGFDLKTIGFLIPEIKLIDLRNCLTLEEILYILNRSFIFFGKDSGIMHLAAASTIPHIFCYGFQSKYWFPKCEPSRILGAYHKNTNYSEVMEKLQEEFLEKL